MQINDRFTAIEVYKCNIVSQTVFMTLHNNNIKQDWALYITQSIKTKQRIHTDMSHWLINEINPIFNQNAPRMYFRLPNIHAPIVLLCPSL